ncbi:hypothetical protein [Thiocapsa marina]|uniref:hypothetical protein n=1 Tax=Thiocapsa marina TaxID=244573 RepID=UPI001F354CAF|nr:hypothetical protein [Thiocapsa marina]
MAASVRQDAPTKVLTPKVKAHTKDPGQDVVDREGLGGAGPDELCLKPRLTGIEDISEAKRTIRTRHVALDARRRPRRSAGTLKRLERYPVPSTSASPAGLEGA